MSGAAVVSTLAVAETAARELTRAERRRQRRKEEREEDREERRKRDHDDDDGDDDRVSLVRARHEALMDRASGSNRRQSAQQAVDDEATDDRTNGGGGQARRQQDNAELDGSADEVIVREAAQTLDDTDTGTETGSDIAAIRVGSGTTFASIDPATGTAIAESNGVRAIAGPDGAFIEGTPGGTSDPALPGDDFDDPDGNDDGDDLIDDGGNNDEDFAS